MIDLFRRAFLSGSAALLAAPAILRTSAVAAAQPVDLGARLTYPFAVPPLPYAYDANEPSVDAQTMTLHHDKHHAAYVTNLNAALKEHPDLHGVALADLLARVPSLPDALWARMEPQLPPRPPHPLSCHNPRTPDRAAMDAIFFVLRTGCQWNALRETGLCSAAHRRFREWRQAGVFAAFWRDDLLACDEVAGVDWTWLALDGAMGKAPLGGEKNRPQPDRSAAMRSIVGWARRA